MKGREEWMERFELSRSEGGMDGERFELSRSEGGMDGEKFELCRRREEWMAS